MKNGRPGLLTDQERQYLLGKRKFTPKRRSKFLISLQARIKAGTRDLKIINQTKIDYVNGWLVLNTEPALLLVNEFDNYNQARLCQPVYLGRIRYRTEIKGKRKKVRYYWYDAHDKSSPKYEDIFKPDHRLRGITGYKTRNILREAFEIQRQTNQATGLGPIERVQQDIIPNKAAEALPISEIRERYIELKKKPLLRKKED